MTAGRPDNRMCVCAGGHLQDFPESSSAKEDDKERGPEPNPADVFPVRARVGLQGP